MNEIPREDDAKLGFLTIIESSDHGYLGGLLILNRYGRPLEFHCTAPIRPSRAHQILYGPTLRPFLFGERIAQSLVQHAGEYPSVLVTDTRDATCLELKPASVVLHIDPMPAATDASEQTQDFTITRAAINEAPVSSQTNGGASGSDSVPRNTAQHSAEQAIGTQGAQAPIGSVATGSEIRRSAPDRPAVVGQLRARRPDGAV